MTDRKKVINELRFQLDSKEVKDQHYPVQLSASDANTILVLLKEQEAVVRCGECTRGHLVSSGFCVCEKYGNIHYHDWFCADGERRTE